MDTPPQDAAVYRIMDVRNPDAGAITLTQLKSESEGTKPPTPPVSAEQSSSADAFDSEDLADTIIDALNKPRGAKSIPTFVLYDNQGLQLFNDITYLDEYYLTKAEMAILKEHADKLVDHLEENSVIIELGAGSLRKTSIILNAIERRKRKVTYYALDLDQNELERSLESLGVFSYVELVGLLGTFEQGIPWLSQQFDERTKKMFLYLGSSIGNMNRREAALFLHRIQQSCMNTGDLFVIGFDKRKDPATIKHAYDDSQGVTREFIMNGLDHVNAIVGHSLIERSKFSYDSRYQSEVGRHVAHYKALEDMLLSYHRPQGPVNICIERGELIHVEYSYKYSDAEIMHVLSASQLDKIEQWHWNGDQYALVLAQRCPFTFTCNPTDVLSTIFPDASEIDVLPCQSCSEDHDVKDCRDLVHLSPRNGWPKTLPSLSEWLQLWRAWDVVTRTMMDHRTMLFERPIAFRHPFIFYLGHIPAFLDIQLSRHGVDSDINPGSPLTEPRSFAAIFERGIDPDMDNPAKCNPHSEVPINDDEWPSVESILEYQEKVRTRLQNLLQRWESQSQDGRCCGLAERVTWMCYEHEAMHIETLLYMLLQSPNTRPPLPHDTWVASTAKPECLDPAPLLSIVGGQATVGHDDPESAENSAEFGWDNEHPQRAVHVATFEIQTRPVTNGEYLGYMDKCPKVPMPASWTRLTGSNEIGVRTPYGAYPLSQTMNWPVQVSYLEANAYARFHGMRIPTEPELIRFRTCAANMQQRKTPNIGFKSWHPTNVSNDEVHTLGDVWEWSSTVWDRYDGFVPSKLYPGYSADFTDQKHHVVLGASWATVPRIAERLSFRNWYQAAYPYVFAGFRCCK